MTDDEYVRHFVTINHGAKLTTVSWLYFSNSTTPSESLRDLEIYERIGLLRRERVGGANHTYYWYLTDFGVDALQLQRV